MKFGTLFLKPKSDGPKRCSECKCKLEKLTEHPGQFVCKNGHVTVRADTNPPKKHSEGWPT